MDMRSTLSSLVLQTIIHMISDGKWHGHRGLPLRFRIPHKFCNTPCEYPRTILVLEEKILLENNTSTNIVNDAL